MLKKQFLSTIMIIVMLCSMITIFPIDAYALEEDWEYVLHDGDTTVAITGYTGIETEIVIPSTIEGKPVTRIDSDAFLNNTEITAVTVPNSVLRIESGTFQNSMVNTIDLGEGLTYIGQNAFNGAKLVNITIPSSVTEIGNTSFANNRNLCSVTINGNNLLTLGDGAFSITSISSFRIPTSLSTIADWTFNDTNLSSLTIPANITSIGYNAFGNNVNLNSVLFEGNAPIMADYVFSIPSSGFTVYYYSGAGGFTTPTWTAGSATLNTVELEVPSTFDISEGNITIADGTNTGTYKVIYGDPQMERDNIPQDQSITIWGTTATANKIAVTATEGNVKICLNGLEITGGMSLSSSENRNVEILLADDSANIIRNSLSNASPATGGGLVITCEHADEPGHICDEHCGSLNVYGPSGNGAGISGHNLTINGGNIYAKGGNSSPGIGKYGGTATNLRFNGGNITASGNGSYGTAGIGGGDISNADGIYIYGGIINASGVKQGAGIGGGDIFYGSGGQAHNIIIHSGTVMASSGYDTAYDIGGVGDCSNIQINGGSVNASSIKIQPVNASAEEVYQTIITLEGINTVTRVTDIQMTGADYYNISEIFTDASGKIYLYLPQDSTVTSITAAGNTYTGNIVTTLDGLANAVFELVDIVPPIITAGDVNRISDTEATVSFSSNESGEYYYQVVEDDAPEPSIDTSANGIICDTSEQTISLDSLAAGAKDIHIAVKDEAGNVSEQVKMDIAEYIPPSPGTLQFEASSHGTYEGYNGWMIGVTRTGGSDGEVSVSYAMADGTAIAGTHYQAYSGTLTWADGDSSRKVIMFTSYDDSVFNGYLNLTCVLSDPTGGAVLGIQNPLNIKISDNDTPPVPTGLTATAGDKEVTLSWDSVKDAYYKVYCSESSGSFTEEEDYVASVYDGTNYTVENLKNGTLYYFAVKAGHNIYYSDYSDEDLATPKAPTGGGTVITYYSITASAGRGGSLLPSGNISVKKNQSQTFTITPESGYVITDVLVDGVSIGAVAEYTFSEITKDHTIEASFEHPSKRFSDVDSSQWYREGVDFVLRAGLFDGTSETTFEPNTNMTRAMLVTVLWRLEDEPDTTIADLFVDIIPGTWYTEAVAWAAENNIVEGYDADSFGPNDAIRREQMAAILYRYARYKGYDLTAANDLTAFADASDVSSWALTAMKWAVAEELITGISETSLALSGNASRAQVATILMRFIENVVK
ncbi:leucine-rich repeat protein [Phosphitispora fastidiosa]|uniref:leucine-rich repeat protein n=1 Tax=Phosphitispora fastidiosa TaxID=2837202 RepID=UPI001E3DA3BD|nr:leucine-rich repeat protein [Phosphitispora fastidiosa]MBU7006031.1 CheY-specific phosphatase CheX [Phosphitispora fastidiosa]